MNKPTKNFAQWIYYNQGSNFKMLSIKKDQAIEFLQQQVPNEKGYIKMYINEQKNEPWKFYIVVWEDKEKKEPQQNNPWWEETIPF